MRTSLPKAAVCVSVVVAYMLNVVDVWKSLCIPTHTCSYIWLTHLIKACIHRQTQSVNLQRFVLEYPPCSWIHRHTVPSFNRPTFLPRCDHTSPSLPHPPPSLPLTLSCFFPLPSLALTVTSRLKWHLISISLPPQTCNICSPLFLSSPLFSCVLPVSAPPLREHAACVIFCTVTLLRRQPKRNMHQSRETFLPQKNPKTHTPLTFVLHTRRHASGG